MHLMDGPYTSSFGRRVVVLARNSGETGLMATVSREINLEWVPVNTAYEAAAELLASPAIALIVDLALLPARHTRLIKIARSIEVPVFGVGSLPPGLSADQLSGVRLASRDELGEMLLALLKEDSTTAATATEAPNTTARPLVPHESVSPPTTSGQKEQAGEYHPEPPAPAEACKEPPLSIPPDPDKPQVLLTPEELTALLENES